MLSDSDISPTRHARALVGGVLAGFFQRTDIYVSGGAENQVGWPIASTFFSSRTTVRPRESERSDLRRRTSRRHSLFWPLQGPNGGGPIAVIASI